MSAARRGAFAAATLTFTAFAIPALYGAGDFSAARLAPLGLAFALAGTAATVHRNDTLRRAFPYRALGLGPGIILSAAILGAMAVLYGWRDWSGAPLADLASDARALWAFPWSPVVIYAASGASPGAVSCLIGLLTVAVALILIFGVLALLAPVRSAATVFDHAALWRGRAGRGEAEDLARRGAKGITPLRPRESRRPAIRRYLLIRAAALLFFAVILAYAPAAFSLLRTLDAPELRVVLDPPIWSDPFLSTWAMAVWAALVAATGLFAFGYVRLALALGR